MKTTVKNIISLVAIILLTCNIHLSFGQVGINTTTPNTSSMLDITSTNKGVLIPRMTSAQRLAIPAPATGLMVYETTTNQFFYFDGTTWRPMASNNSAWNTLGNAGTTPVSNFIGTTDLNDFAVRTGNTERMRVTSNGNVGIGTATPGSAIPDTKLDVIGPVTGQGPTIRAGGGGDVVLAGGGSLFFDNNYSFLSGNYIRPIGGANNMGFFTSGAERMRIIPTGNVGIGNSTPASKLHVVKAGVSGIAPDANAIMTVENSTSGYINILTPSTNENGILFGIGGGFASSASNGGIIYNSSSTRKGFQFRNDGNSTKMVLDSNGRVGIGVISPAYKLDIFSSGINDTLIYRGRNSSADGTVTQIGSVEFFLDAINTINFAGGSNFGINLPGSASFSLQVGGTGTAAKPGGGSWTNPSDSRLKEDVNPFKDGLSTIRDINPVYYKYNGKAGNPDNYYVGVIAQELNKVAPYMVSTYEYLPKGVSLEEAPSKIETYLCVDNSALSYVTVNALKELDKKVQTLENAHKTIQDFGILTIQSKVTFVPFSADFKSLKANSSIPVITASPLDTIITLSITDITADGFKIKTNAELSTPVQVNWMAITRIAVEATSVSPDYSDEERNAMLSKVKIAPAKIDLQKEIEEMAKRKSSVEIK